MKKGILILSVIISVQANAQSIKDALFGGKLKNDSNSVVKKGDDLSTKIDTSRKKPVEPEKTKPAVVAIDPTAKLLTGGRIDPIVPLDSLDKNAGPKENNKTWKEFVDNVVSTLNAEVMNSSKVKKGEYFVIVDYAIETDGRVTITNVLPTPENKFLADQIKERLSIDTPHLNPVIAGNGLPRKAIKRFNFKLASK